MRATISPHFHKLCLRCCRKVSFALHHNCLKYYNIMWNISNTKHYYIHNFIQTFNNTSRRDTISLNNRQHFFFFFYYKFCLRKTNFTHSIVDTQYIASSLPPFCNSVESCNIYLHIYITTPNGEAVARDCSRIDYTERRQSNNSWLVRVFKIFTKMKK